MLVAATGRVKKSEALRVCLGLGFVIFCVWVWVLYLFLVLGGEVGGWRIMRRQGRWMGG